MSDTQPSATPQRPYPIEKDGWSIEQIFGYLTEWLPPEEAVNQLNLLAHELPLYHFRRGNEITPEARASGRERWTLNKGKQIIIANHVTVEHEFRAFIADVHRVWSKPDVQPRRKSGRKPEFDWIDLAGELIRRVHGDGIHDESDENIAERLLNWCSEKRWPADKIPSMETTRKNVARLLRPLRSELGR